MPAASPLAADSNIAKNAIFGFVGIAVMCYKLLQKNIRLSVPCVVEDSKWSDAVVIYFESLVK
jgi:hypothetical protein